MGVYYCYKPVYFVVSTLFGLLKVLPPISGLASPPPRQLPLGSVCCGGGVGGLKLCYGGERGEALCYIGGGGGLCVYVIGFVWDVYIFFFPPSPFPSFFLLFPFFPSLVFFLFFYFTMFVFRRMMCTGE